MAMTECKHSKGNLIHHRNPSGFNNKVNYLLVKSKRNKYKIQQILSYIVILPGDLSWYKAAIEATRIIDSVDMKSRIHKKETDYMSNKVFEGLVDKLRNLTSYRAGVRDGLNIYKEY